MKPMIIEFGWNRGLISLAFFLNMTIFSISLVIAGKSYDRYGPKWVIIISTLFLSAGFMSISFIDTFWQYFLSYGLLSAIGLGGTSVSLMAAITSKWFNKRRGLAISMALAGSSIGQFVLVPLFTAIVLRYGWRASYFYTGLIMMVVNVTLVLFIIKRNPVDYIRTPEKSKNNFSSTPDNNENSPNKDPQDLGLRQAMRTYSFWLFLIVMFICGTGDFLIAAHLIAFVTDYGISPTSAGNMLAWFGLMSLAGLLIAGPASDWVGNKTPIAITFLVRFLLFILILNDQSFFSLYLFALVFGSTFLVTAPLTTTLVERLNGLSHVGVITGFIGTIHHFGGGLWAYFGGLSFDYTGSYRFIFSLSAGMSLIAFLCSIFIREKRHYVGS